jgi:hypothetical protein
MTFDQIRKRRLMVFSDAEIEAFFDHGSR